ncbi:hypothetical protein EV1_028237 [Malus domestica]
MRYTDHDFGFDFDLDGELEDASDLIDRDSEEGDDNFGGLGLGFRNLTEGNVLESRRIISGEQLNSLLDRPKSLHVLNCSI